MTRMLWNRRWDLRLLVAESHTADLWCCRVQITTSRLNSGLNLVKMNYPMIPSRELSRILKGGEQKMHCLSCCLHALGQGPGCMEQSSTNLCD